MSGSRRRAGALACLALLTACSGKGSHAGPEGTASSSSRPGASATAAALTAAETATLQDGASALYALGTSDLSSGDRVRDLNGAGPAAHVVGGTIAKTDGPAGGAALQFFRSGRIVTDQSRGLSGRDTYSVQFDLRADRCVTSWGRVLGTGVLTGSGREGFEVIHFPTQFTRSRCELGVEYWHHGRYVGGCGLSSTPPAPQLWRRYTVVHVPGRVSCYVDGVLHSSLPMRDSEVQQAAALGLGGNGSGYQGPADGISLGHVAVFPTALAPAVVARSSRA